MTGYLVLGAVGLVLIAGSVAAMFMAGGRLGDEQFADPTPADVDAPIELEPVYDQQPDTDDWRRWTDELRKRASS